MYRLLVVDDEILIADGMYEAIRDEKIENLSLEKAYSVSEALEISKQQRIDILLTDISMPEMNGFELYEKVQKMWPQCRVIFLTGFQKYDFVYRAIQYKNVRYIVKAEGVGRALEVIRDVIIEMSLIQGTENFASGDSMWGEAEDAEYLSTSEIIKKVQELVEKNLYHDISISMIAQELYFNPYYLSRTFKLETGITLADYILEKKMKCAEKMLQESNCKVRNIAEKLGYSSPANFIRCFKKYFGMTPNEYRRR